MNIQCLVIVTSLMAVFSFGQSMGGAVIVNLNKANWTHESEDPPGTESVVLREDTRTGGLELLVSYPPGHVFAPHSHDSNERIFLIEGRLAVGLAKDQKFVEPGGYAFLPAREVQHLACVSRKRCRFYVSWDGDPRTRPAGN
jgi:quercetin dioxygenase-like cupin family protein